ncbi:MAG: TatD family deoxyribonuclease [Dehalococcoidia bacterium]|nr:TatD family deoxyribonuclease [Dehalococcoidia bacterium]
MISPQSRRTPAPVEPLRAPVVDAHAHLYSREFEEDRNAVLERAWGAGLRHIVEVGTSSDSSTRALALANTDPRIHPVVGLHPHSASKLAEERPALERLVAAGGYVGIGEIGLDFFRNNSPPEAQYAVLHWQLELASTHGLPVVIHSRDADEECYAVIEAWASLHGRYRGPDLEIGMMHCYAGDLDLARRYLDLGFLISVPGPVTYANNTRGRGVAAEVPLNRLLVETDSPYLTPVPWRGQRNEPAYVVQTIRAVAEIRGESAELVAAATAANAARLFGFQL